MEVRALAPGEAGLVVDYFHDAEPEHLELLGVDPSRLPARDAWLRRLEDELARPLEQRAGFFLVWRLDGQAAGFSSCDKIRFGERANMHLHITAADRRAQGLGAEFVKLSVPIYFERLRLKALYCEPNAFNVAPNRTLQKAGFKYLKTHMTVPGPLNFHQAVTRWVIEAEQASVR